ncbi:MAG: ATP-binding cassette domain-containing protein [Pyrinomonadaceae bacterium]
MTLIIKDLSKSSGDQLNIRGLSFSVDKGEVFGILGSDESGKTEILKILSGLEKKTNGTIEFDGKMIENGRKSGFLYVVEETASRWKNIFSSSDSGSQASTHAKLTLAALEEVENVLLFENPVQNLDVIQTNTISRRIKKITKEKGICTIVVSNDPAEIFGLCDRVAILDNGELVQTGSPREVYTNPNCTASARLFGNNNLIAVRRITSSKSEMPEFFTVEGEHRIVTDPVEKSELGALNETITLAILPEHLALSFGASFPEDNLLKVRVENIEFHGPTTSITLNAGGLILRAIVLRTVGLNIGDECMVGLPPDRIKILKT